MCVDLVASLKQETKRGQRYILIGWVCAIPVVLFAITGVIGVLMYSEVINDTLNMYPYPLVGFGLFVLSVLLGIGAVVGPNFIMLGHWHIDTCRAIVR